IDAQAPLLAGNGAKKVNPTGVIEKQFIFGVPNEFSNGTAQRAVRNADAFNGGQVTGHADSPVGWAAAGLRCAYTGATDKQATLILSDLVWVAAMPASVDFRPSLCDIRPVAA